MKKANQTAYMPMKGLISNLGTIMRIQLMQKPTLFPRFNEVYETELRKLDQLGRSITVVVQGNKSQSIGVISDDFEDLPSSVYINNDLTELSYGNKVILPKEGYNTIKMVWNHTLQDCSLMFERCSVISVDFKDFDSSEVTNIEYMFDGAVI